MLRPVDEFPDTHIPEEGAIFIVACEEDYGKGVLDVFRCLDSSFEMDYIYLDFSGKYEQFGEFYVLDV